MLGLGSLLVAMGRRSALAVTSITPSAGPSTGGTSVTIRGTGFEPGMAVVFFTSDESFAELATDVVVESSTKITCKSPAGAPGHVWIGVGVLGDWEAHHAFLEDAFTYESAASAPVLTSLDFDLADTAGGDTLRATGSNLDGGVVEVSDGSGGWTEADTVDKGSDFIAFAMPARAPGTYSVRVKNGSGTSNALAIEAWSPQHATSATCIHRWRPDLSAVESLSDGSVTRFTDTVGAMHQSQNVIASYRFVKVEPLAAYGNKLVFTSSTGGGGSGYTRESDSALACPISVLIVGDAPTLNYSAFGSTADASPFNLFWAQTAANYVEFYTDTGQLNTNGTGVVDSKVPHAYLFTDDGTGSATASKLYVDDLATSRAATVSRWKPCTGWNVGAGGAGVPNNRGHIAEEVIWSGELSAADRVRLRKYMAVRYGLS